MSRCSKKCNEIKEKIDSISGLDDDFVFEKLETLEWAVSVTVEAINKYADKDELNGTCFKKSIEEDIKTLEDYAYALVTISSATEQDIKISKAIENILADRERLEKENTEQQEKLNKIKQYVDREVDLLTDTIEDYIDDDREGNKDIIGSFKEEREQWRDIQRIMKNEGKLYFNLEK